MAKKKDKTDRSTITARNRQRKQKREDARRAKLIARTHSLVNSHVAVRVKDHARPLTGTVLAVISKGDDRYPKDAVRQSGNYLNIRTTIGDILVSRHRVKPIKEEH